MNETSKHASNAIKAVNTIPNIRFCINLQKQLHQFDLENDCIMLRTTKLDEESALLTNALTLSCFSVSSPDKQVQIGKYTQWESLISHTGNSFSAKKGFMLEIH